MHKQETAQTIAPAVNGRAVSILRSPFCTYCNLKSSPIHRISARNIAIMLTLQSCFNVNFIQQMNELKSGLKFPFFKFRFKSFKITNRNMLHIRIIGIMKNVFLVIIFSRIKLGKRFYFRYNLGRILF
jgi:hypothetical protein